MKSNFAYNLISLGSRLLVGLVLFVVLARFWGPAKFGTFTFVFSFTTLLVLLVDFGFHLYLLREVARCPSQAATLIGDSYRAKLVLMAGAGAIGLCLIAAIGPSALPPSIVAPLFLTALALSFSELFVAPLRALGHFDQEAVVVILANVVQFVLVGLTAWFGGSVAQVAWAMFVSRGIYLILAYRTIHRAVPQLALRRPTAKGSLDTLRRVWTYGAEATLILAWSHLDIVAVRALFGTEVVGAYSAGQKIVFGFLALTAAVGNVIIPRLSRLSVNLDVRFWRLTRNTTLTMSTIGAGIALPFVLFPATFIEILYGHEFRGLAYLMPYFGLIILFRYVNVAASAAAVAAGLLRTRIIAPLLGLLTIALLVPAIVQFGLTPRGFMLIYIIGIAVMMSSYIWSLARFRANRIGE